MLGGDWELGQHLSKIETRRTVVAIWENPPQTCTAAILLFEQFCYFEMLPPLALPGG